jgi:succinate-semialdehyde dehydrogenase / glutarate-semialdehyde dehydrogenase
MTAVSVNPATGQIIGRYERHSEREIDRRLQLAADEYAHWCVTDIGDRATRFRSIARRLRERCSALAELIATEMGKPLEQGKSEVEKCSWVCEHYAEHARELLEPVTVATDARTSKVVYRPLGSVLALMPWNFPLWQLFRFAAPRLMAGNVAVLRHASNVTGCARWRSKCCFSKPEGRCTWCSRTKTRFRASSTTRGSRPSR